MVTSIIRYSEHSSFEMARFVGLVKSVLGLRLLIYQI